MNQFSLVRTYLLSSLCCIPTCSLYSQTLPKESTELIGNVKTIRNRHFNAQLLSDSSLKLSNQIYYNYKVEYDANNSPVLLIEYDTSDVEKSRTIYEYNQNNQDVLRRHYINGQLEFLDSIFYANKNSKYYLLKSFDESMNLRFKLQATINNKGLHTKVVSIDSSGIQVYQRKLRYNSKGNPLKITEWGSSGQVLVRMFFKYNRNKQVVQVRFHRDSRFLRKRKTQYVYNDRGFISETRNFSIYEPKYFTSIYTYEYDNFGNWIKKYQYTSEGDLNSLTDRVIEYY